MTITRIVGIMAKLTIRVATVSLSRMMLRLVVEVVKLLTVSMVSQMHGLTVALAVLAVAYILAQEVVPSLLVSVEWIILGITENVNSRSLVNVILRAVMTRTARVRFSTGLMVSSRDFVTNTDRSTNKFCRPLTCPSMCS